MHKLADSAVVMYEKLQATQYTPTAEVAVYAQQMYQRYEKHNPGHGVMTFIASDPVTLLAIIPPYEDYRIIRMYPYSKTMVAADVWFKMSKKQDMNCRIGLYGAMLSYKDPFDFTQLNEEEIKDMMECRSGGFAYAQTYHTGDTIPMNAIPPFGDEWRINQVAYHDGRYDLGEDRHVQVWRRIFTHIGNKPVRDGNRLKFGLDLATKYQSSFFLEDRLHALAGHPEWQYAWSDDGAPPYGYYWQENIHITQGLEKAEGDTGTTWRRPSARTVNDIIGIWMQPAVSAMLLNPEGFGKMFGPILPKGMAGIDFSEGPIASINWFGNLSFQIRNRDGSVREEQNWTPATFIPLRKDMMMQALTEFDGEKKFTMPE